MKPGWPYASVTSSETPGGPVSRVAAPFWLRIYVPLPPVLMVLSVVFFIAPDDEPTSGQWWFVLVFLAGGMVVAALEMAVYLRPFAEAGPKGLRGRGMGTERLVPWMEVSEVLWAHRFGLGLYTRTELLIVRAGSKDREPHSFCVLHFLRGIWLGQRCSRSASRPFLEVCGRYGASTKSPWSAPPTPKT